MHQIAKACVGGFIPLQHQQGERIEKRNQRLALKLAPEFRYPVGGKTRVFEDSHNEIMLQHDPGIMPFIPEHRMLLARGRQNGIRIVDMIKAENHCRSSQTVNIAKAMVPAPGMTSKIIDAHTITNYMF